MTEYIVASIGGCGSRLMAQMLSDATGRERCNDEYTGDWRGHILHTHRPYTDEFAKVSGEWRAVYMVGHIGNAICAFYERRNSDIAGLRLMGVDMGDIDTYQARYDNDPVGAWLYLIEGDRLRWRENIRSWTTAPNTLTVYYKQLCVMPYRTAAQVSDHIGAHVAPPTITARRSNWLRLPVVMREAIIREYGDYMIIPEALDLYYKIADLTQVHRWLDE